MLKKKRLSSPPVPLSTRLEEEGQYALDIAEKIAKEKPGGSTQRESCEPPEGSAQPTR